MRVSIVQEAVKARLSVWFNDPAEVADALTEIMADIREAIGGRKTAAQKAAHRSYMRKYQANKRAAARAEGVTPT